MTDLTNKVDEITKEDIKVLQNIVNEFSTVLGDIKNNDIPYVAYIIYVARNHINNKYEEFSSDWKSWGVFFVRHQYLKGNLTKLSQIPILIDKFFEYYNNDYNDYCKDTFAASDYDRDRGFIQYCEIKMGVK